MNSRPFRDGQIIHGKYELLRTVGSGPHGFVVAARHIGFDDIVALKFLWPKLATDAEIVSRFTSEARATFRLRSEHVVRVLDVDMFRDVPFVAMELLEGSDLRSMLRLSRTLDVAFAVDCLLQACAALSAAHCIGAIHGNIKPENLFLVGSDHLKVLDFGLRTAAPIDHDLDARSDLWSLGCVLFELLTGTSPFDRKSSMQSSTAACDNESAPLIDLPPTVPQALSETIMRCLREDPAERFTDVAELACALSPFGSGRFSAYAARCRASLDDKGPDRRSTPRPLAPVRHLSTGAAPAAISGSERPAPVDTNCNEPAVRQLNAAKLLTEVPNTGYNGRAATSRVPTLLATQASLPVRPHRATVLFGVGQTANEPSTTTQPSDDRELSSGMRPTHRLLFWSGALAVALVSLLVLMLLRHDERSPTLKHSLRVEPRSEAVAVDANAAMEAAAAGTLPMVKPLTPAVPVRATMSASRARPHPSRDGRLLPATAPLYTSSSEPSMPTHSSADPEVGF